MNTYRGLSHDKVRFTGSWRWQLISFAPYPLFQLTFCSMNNIWRWLSALFCVYSSARAHVCTLGTGCCACPLRRLRDFPLRVRVHNDVSGLRERNFGKSRRWRYQKHRQSTGRRASQKIPREIFVVTLLYVMDIHRNTDTISDALFGAVRRSTLYSTQNMIMKQSLPDAILRIN